ncbi:FG-GAP-like repeat-containing protein [Larkinella sp. VNQ87]|uniref:FG-GAP-like repeat-containing protein n=1 Tax=Larkinella sp. VNQ87 TaxID=3400921 RepID=UPI003C0C8B52
MKAFLPLLFIFITLRSFGQSPAPAKPGTGWTFRPEATFKGSSLAGFQPIGGADWRAQNGEIIATLKSGNGWLLLDRGYQDVGFHAAFQCTGGSETGVLFRVEKTAGGLKGVLVSITDKEVGSYRVTLDAQGKELTREKLRSAGSIVRLAPPPNPNAPAGGGGNNANRRPSYFGLKLPISRVESTYRPDDWNQVEIFLDNNIIRTFLNDSGEMAGGAADEDAGRYGSIALYAGGTGEVRFRDLGYKDASLRVTPEEKTSALFRVQRINDMYYSWGAGAGDFNNDGNPDIVAGPYIYYGPDFTKSREIFPAIPFNPSKEFTDVNCQYTYDFNGDGWLDILTGPPRATVYLNPKGESRRWDKFEVVVPVQTEITLFKDIDGDGKPELIYGAEGELRYAKPDPADPTKKWIVHPVSEKGYSLAHGIGVGDINGDGKLDIVNPNGWWEQPATTTGGLWAYHSEALARYGHRGGGVGGSTMAVYDVNGDKLNDVVTGLNAHGFGLGWYEQKRDADGKISFAEHIISDDFSTKNAGDVTFSQPHGSTQADVDGDGIPDFVVGKRYWSHLDNYFDPDPYGAPVLYWYRTVRNPKAPGGAEFVPELVHNRSGAGSDVLAADLNKDGAIDLVTSTDRGTFIFWNQVPPTRTKK